MRRSDTLIIPVTMGSVKPLAMRLVLILTLIVILLPFTGLPLYDPVTYIPISILIAMPLLWIVRGIRINRAVRSFLKRFNDLGLTPLPGERLEIYEATIKGKIVRRERTKTKAYTYTYITNKSFERVGEALMGYDLYELEKLGSEGALAVFPMNEGLFRGKILRISGGAYDGIMIIPIFPKIGNKSIEERVEGDGEICIYRLELNNCNLRCYITPLASKKARSYRVEVKIAEELDKEIPSEESTIFYSEGSGSLEADSFICRPIVIIIHARSIDMNEIANNIKKALGKKGTLFIGYRGDMYVLKLIIDRPLARDIVKEITI